MDFWMFKWYSRSLIILKTMKEKLLFSKPWLSNSEDRAAPDLSVLLNTEARESLNALAFFLFLLVRGSSTSSISPVFSLDLFLLLTCLKKLLLSDTKVASINSSWDLAFLVFSLQTWLSYMQSAFLKISSSPTDPSLKLSQSVSPGYRPRNIFLKTDESCQASADLLSWILFHYYTEILEPGVDDLGLPVLFTISTYCCDNWGKYLCAWGISGP